MIARIKLALFCLSAGLVLAVAAPAPAEAAAPVLSAPRPGSGATSPPVPMAPAIPDPQARPAERDDHGDEHNHGSTKDGKESVIQTVDLPVLPALVTSSKSTWDAGYEKIRTAIVLLNGEASRLKLEPKGRPLVIYTESDDNGFRFDMLLPLTGAPKPELQYSGGIRPGHNPGGKALKFEHRGAYAEIEKTYEAITAYLDQKDLAAREFFIEEFINDVPDPNDIKMAVNIYVFLK